MDGSFRWSSKPIEQKSNILLLSIDCGIKGFLAVSDYRRLICLRPIPSCSEQVEFKTRRAATRSQFNYTACYQLMTDFLDFAKSRDKRAVMIYENTRPVGFQNINSTVLQHVGIEMWPIMAAISQLECYPWLASEWKRKAKLSKDKSQSIKSLAEVCPTASAAVEGNHDAAEAILLGHTFFQHYELSNETKS